jgi:hypothetical protein
MVTGRWDQGPQQLRTRELGHLHVQKQQVDGGLLGQQG